MPSRKALVIGLNYPWNEASLVESFLKEKRNFPPENIRVLKEDGDDPSSLPTAQKIKEALKDLCDECQQGDTICLYFAGHSRDVDGEQGIVGSDNEIVPGLYLKIVANGFARKCRVTIMLEAPGAEKIFEDFFEPTFNRSKDPKGVILFTSSQELKFSDPIGIKSPRSSRSYCGIFTHLSTVIQKSDGGEITNRKLAEGVKNIVKELPEHKGHKQHVGMQCTSFLDDLPFLAEV